MKNDAVFMNGEGLGGFKSKRTGTRFRFAELGGAFRESGYYEGAVDQDQLLKDLLAAFKKGEVLKDFYYRDYQGKFQRKTIALPAHTHGGQAEIQDRVNQFVRTSVLVQRPLIGVRGRLNKKVGGDVFATPIPEIQIDLEERKTVYRMTFVYAAGTPSVSGDESVIVASRGEEDVFSLAGDRIRAVEFLTHDFDSFLDLFAEFGLDQVALAKSTFKNARPITLAERTPNRVSNYYFQIPEPFLLTLPPKDLYSDLEKILAYDLAYRFTDSSSGAVKALGALFVQQGGKAYLYDQLVGEQSRAKELYEEMDGDVESAYHGGQVVSRKTLFASMLLFLSSEMLDALPEERDQRETVFFIDSESKVNSKLVAGDDQSGYFDLQQMRWQKSVAHLSSTPTYLESPNIEPTEDGYWVPSGPFITLHPLDLVTLVSEGPDGEALSMAVPAIFVKDIAHHREWAEWNLAFRIGMDLIIVAISLATLAGSPGALMSLVSAADLTLAGTDFVVQAFKSQIGSTEEGKAFLALWDRVFVIGGVVTGVILLPTLLQSGVQLLSKVAVEVRGQLLVMLKEDVEASKSLARWVQHPFEIVMDFRYYLSGNLRTVMENLAAEGVYVLKEVREGKETYHLGFRDVVFRSGNMSEMKQTIQELWLKGRRGMKRMLANQYIRSKGTFYGLKYIEGTVKESPRMVRQEFDYSCVAACFRQRAKDYGVFLPEEFFRVQIKVTEEGADYGDSLKAMEKFFKDFEGVKPFGDQAFPFKFPARAKPVLKKLCENKVPWVAHLKLYEKIEDAPLIINKFGEEVLEESGHAVIVDQLIDDVVFIRDPTGFLVPFGKGGSGVEAQMLVDDFLDIWGNTLYEFFKFE